MPCNAIAVQRAQVAPAAIINLTKRPEVLKQALADLGIEAQVSVRLGNLVILTPKVQINVSPDSRLWIYPNRVPLNDKQRTQIANLISQALQLAAVRYVQTELVLAAQSAGMRLVDAGRVPGGIKVTLEI